MTDSADQAGRIYSLYARDSWDPTTSSSLASQLNGPETIIGPSTSIPAGISAPNGHAYGPDRAQAGLAPTASGTRRGSTDDPAGNGTLGPQTPYKTQPTITITPDHSTTLHSTDHSLLASSVSSSAARASTLTPSHSPKKPSSLSPNRSNGTASPSQASIGSSQYPGEEADAFHVRSTCKCGFCQLHTDVVDARLEAEGVYGDGWDPGVERTRGGPSQGRRATLHAANYLGVDEKEKAYLANLDRWVSSRSALMFL